MSENLAADYADSIAEHIRANCDAGTPFGIATEDGPVDGRETGEEISASDYLDDLLDIQYIVSSDHTYRAARICITLGGPTAWINTMTEQLEVAWWSATEYRDLPREFIEALDEALEEYWDMGA